MPSEFKKDTDIIVKLRKDPVKKYMSPLVQQATPHFHYQYEFLFVLAGSADFVIEGKMYHVVKGSMLFISNTENHCIVRSTKGYERFVLRLSTEVLSAYIKDPSLVSIFKQRPQSFNHQYNCDAEDFQNFRMITSLMLNEYIEQNEYWDQFIIALLNIILIQVYRKCPDIFPLSPTTENRQLIFLVQNYIESHVGEDLSLETLSSIFYVSKYYLSHSFSHECGISLKQFIIRVRIAKAKHLLLHTEEDVKTIADEVGFHSVSHFIHTFEESEQISPLKYRKQGDVMD